MRDITRIVGDCLIYQARRKNYNWSAHVENHGGWQWAKGKEVRKERKINVKEAIIVQTFGFRKLKMIPIEMQCFLRTRWRFLKKIGRVASARSFNFDNRFRENGLDT